MTSRHEPSLGARLERDRLERRRRQLEHVIDQLRTRAQQYAADGGHVPPPLTLALQDFQRELTGVLDRLTGAPTEPGDGLTAA